MTQITSPAKPTPTNRLTANTQSFPLHISSGLEQKIRHLCNKFPDLEWSGVLFYTVTGSFENKDLIIYCNDLFLMDIGTAGYTEFDVTVDIAAYMADNPELLTNYSGLIHSHNKMSAFFSGTDAATLEERGGLINHFLSLIVNNAGKYVARITSNVKTQSHLIDKCSYTSFNNETFSYETDEQVETNRIEYFNLNINIDQQVPVPIQELTERIATVEAAAKERRAQALASYRPWEKLTSPAHPAVTQLPATTTFTQPQLFEDPIVELDVKEDNPIAHLVGPSVKQLLSGNLYTDSNVSDHALVNAMTAKFDASFGRSPQGFNNFEAWAHNTIDMICCFPADPVLSQTVMDEDVLAAYIADAILARFSTLQSNKYLETYKKLLLDYTLL